ncbi:MAG: amidohydrolase family protein [Gemmatimonadetes bacterium]|nr:amidohydrolase [Gemmatimonadota bacterium]NIR79506.1 amidohydrolase [Gemmatimonadota bacterium]NIT88183.1 amidohydrolase [Gemmatimonadota bacterium]NIU31990.1 amidohydrolase [Gemmatimonadota bacterium]NIU36602.1 amidohydrolase family protein [Gemmatimonadota bacterium]
MSRGRPSAPARRVSLSLAVGFLFLAAGACGPGPDASADLVLLNGVLFTVDADQPRATALAASGDTIVAVGSDGEIRQWVGEETRVIDLEGRLAIPGLIEGHGHYMSLGESLVQLDLRAATTWSEIVGRVEEAVADAEPGEWIVGRGWHQDRWSETPSPSVEGLPVHDGLSAASPENPVILRHVSGHGIFVNAAAMEAAGIDRSTSDPEGGEIVRDASGRSIGMLRESAAGLVEEVYRAARAQRSPEDIVAERREQARIAGEHALAHGITSFQDMGATWDDLDLFLAMASDRTLPIRVYASIEEPAEELAREGRLEHHRAVGAGDRMLTIRAIGEKVLDGALGTHGGWLLEPYSDLPRSHGMMVTPLSDIRRSAELAIEQGYQMAIQGIGDRAVRELLDLYEEVWEEHGVDGDTLRWRIEHAQVIHPDDLPRFAELGVVPAVQGIFACSDGVWVEERLGHERTEERGYLFKDLLDSGAVVTNGTDPPVEPIDPMASIHCSVTRELPDGSLFFPEQAMSVEEAIRTYTWNNARAAFEEDVKGSLTRGKLADVTVLSRNILEIPADSIPGTRAVYTILGGRVVYEG